MDEIARDLSYKTSLTIYNQQIILFLFFADNLMQDIEEYYDQSPYFGEDFYYRGDEEYNDASRDGNLLVVVNVRKCVKKQAGS